MSSVSPGLKPLRNESSAAGYAMFLLVLRLRNDMATSGVAAVAAIDTVLVTLSSRFEIGTPYAR